MNLFTVAIAVATLSGSALAGPSHAAADSHDVTGYWYTHDRESIIAIDDCGNGSPCGHVMWLADPEEADATDARNHNPELRDRPIQGLQLLAGFDRSEGGWEDGTIYNPENGRSYEARLRRLVDGTLEVKGCVGPICKAMIWTPAPAPAPEVRGAMAD